MSIQQLIEEQSEKLDELFGFEDMSGDCCCNKYAVKDNFKIAQFILLDEVKKIIERKIAIHKQLAGEWTGIRLDGKRNETINPHTEKVEVLSDLLQALSLTKEKDNE